ncbi:MAG: DEAD/DEAH box helicase, partial [Mycoplasmataceae bacterium]|nr:DEAD/DEAH box helicase [Mycoplasmataceae bacterium]
IIKIKKIKTTPIPQIIFNDRAFKVAFLYETVILDYYPQKDIVYSYSQNNKIEIYKNLKLENEVKQEIENFGFEFEQDDKVLIASLTNDNKQHQLSLWKIFLNEKIPLLKKKGYNVIYDDSFSLQFEEDVDIVISNDDEQDGWFNLSFDLEFNGKKQAIAPLISGIIAEFSNLDDMPEIINIEIEKDYFVEIQSKQIRPIINTIIELMDKKDKDGNIAINPYDAHLIDFIDSNIKWKGSKEILELSKKLKDFKRIEKVKPPLGLKATLRDYQQSGLNWLNFLYEFKFGAILADDMGLGKTIQTLSHLLRLKEKKKLTKPSLIVMPTSLVANWKNEAIRFTPKLNVLSLHGDDRAKRFEQIDSYDVLLTTYALVVRDFERFDKMSFEYIILDEAQKIKNHKTKMSIMIKKLKANHRLALSGTPIENHLGELWSIFSFLMPGFLGTASFFNNYYQKPIEKENNIKRQEILNKKIKPFMLRRTKEIVADELPKKTEIIKYTQFESKQSKLYESVRITMDKKVREAVSHKGIGSSHIMILDALLKLRQVCCDPSLLCINEAQKVKESAKLELFLDLIDELLSENRKILVFSQFTSMIAILEEAIKKREISYTKLIGSTKKREEAINKFTKGDASIFFISLRAGGVGLNLVEADTVIHYDPWWNPA